MLKGIIRYFIPYRNLTLIFYVNENNFIKILENDIYSLKNDKRIRLDYLFQGEINKDEKKIAFERVTLSPGWKSGETFYGNYKTNDNNNKMELNILFKISKTHWIFYIGIMIVLLFFKQLFEFKLILVFAIIWYLIINYKLQNDIINIKNNFIELSQKYRIKIEIKQKSILNI